MDVEKLVKLFFVSPLFLTEGAWALYTKPWLGNVYEFEGQGAFTYSRYSKVQDAAVQLKNPSNDKLLAFDLGWVASASCDLQAEVEFAETPRQSFGSRSVALQGRFLWWDDVAGDPCSLISGVNVRQVPRHSLRDVSCPYHSDFNFELTTAAGKEWSQRGIWTARTYALLGVGIANHGAPWLKGMGVWELNRSDRQRFMAGLEGYFGFGNERHVDVDHFNGWAHVHHQSIDVAIGYAYHTPIWGTMGVRYAYRLFAKSFPERVNFITVFYNLPFSFF